MHEEERAVAAGALGKGREGHAHPFLSEQFWRVLGTHPAGWELPTSQQGQPELGTPLPPEKAFSFPFTGRVTGTRHSLCPCLGVSACRAKGEISRVRSPECVNEMMCVGCRCSLVRIGQGSLISNTRMSAWKPGSSSFHTIKILVTTFPLVVTFSIRLR